MTPKSKIALAVLLLLAVILAFAMKRQSDPEVLESESRPRQTVRPSPIDETIERPPVKMVEPERTAASRPAKSDASEKAPESTARAVSKVESTNWAVVAAIYRDYDSAERRAMELGASAGTKPTVYPKRGKGSKYMVVLGSNLTRPKADELREVSLNAGMPGDTYVTKLLPEQ